MKFIYVMQHKDKEKLIELGYVMLKEDLRNNVWIFEDKQTSLPTFAVDDPLEYNGINYVLSDTLTF